MILLQQHPAIAGFVIGLFFGTCAGLMLAAVFHSDGEQHYYGP